MCIRDRRFSDRRIQQILGYPAVFLGSSPYLAPSIYHLMSHLDLTDGVLYPRGGFTEVIAAVRRVAEEQGVRIHTGTEAIELVTTSEGAAGRVSGRARPRVQGLRVRDRAGAERTLPAGLVVGAADLHHLETGRQGPLGPRPVAHLQALHAGARPAGPAPGGAGGCGDQFDRLGAVSYTHLTLPTNREV